MEDGSVPLPQAGTDLRRMRRVTTVSLAALVVISGFLQIALGLGTEAGPRRVILAAATLASVVFALMLVPSLLRSPGDGPSRWPFALGLTVFTAGIWALAMVEPFAGWGWGFMLAVTGGMLGCIVTRWWRVAALVGTIGILGLGIAVFFSGPTVDATPDTEAAGAIVIMGTLVLMTLGPLSTVWVLRVALRLDVARGMSAELAIATERVRFATDLHDIQGHHLQVIALKGELAERRLAAGDTALAMAELSEIRNLARTALEDTRAVVNAYRSVTVAEEARNAAEVLRSAGIDCTARIDVPALAPKLGTVFALAIREGTTNILRHSAATVASFDLVRAGEGSYRLTITNDGAVEPRTGGTGITGLVQRAAAWDGVVDTAYGNGSFTLSLTVPVTDMRPPKEER